MAKLQKRTGFKPRIRSRHPSHSFFRNKDIWPIFPFRSIIRFGSVFVFGDEVSSGGNRIEVNTVAAVNNASNKMVMKKLFAEGGVASAKFLLAKDINPEKMPLSYPLVAKLDFRSKGRGMKKLDNKEELIAFLAENKAKLSHYYVEEYFPCGREFRIHVSPHLKEEIFSVRKMLTEEGKNNGRWYRNHQDGEVYFAEEFEKPPIWANMVEGCITAVKALGMDFGACDVLYSVKSNTFQICEVNSAPSMGEKTGEAYLKALIEILNVKYRKYKGM